MAEVAILGVLHNFHDQVAAYSLAALEDAIERLAPDRLLVELQQVDLEKRDHDYKTEYNVLLPHAQKRRIPVEAMDPEEPLYSEIADSYQANIASFMKNSPEQFQAVSIMAQKMFESLIQDHWKSVADTQSKLTEAFFDLKHRVQEDLFGEGEALGWRRMNEIYLEKILACTSAHPEERILVSIGIEHVYWLKRELTKATSAVNILDLHQMLK